MPEPSHQSYERVAAEDIKIGDVVARARTHRWRKVTEIALGPKSAVLRFEDNSRAVPRRAAAWWRVDDA